MTRKRSVLIAGLVLLTLAQLYVVYEVLLFGWLTATPNQDTDLMRQYAQRWALISIPIGLLWISCLIGLIRMRRRKLELI